MPTARRGEVELRLGRIGHGYRGFGAAHESTLSGSCNMDVECLAAADPWRDPVRASAVISTGGSTFCSGSLSVVARSIGTSDGGRNGPYVTGCRSSGPSTAGRPRNCQRSDALSVGMCAQTA